MRKDIEGTPIKKGDVCMVAIDGVGGFDLWELLIVGNDMNCWTGHYPYCGFESLRTFGNDWSCYDEAVVRIGKL